MTNTGTPDASMPAGAASPFEPLAVPAYVTKVKTMLTGLAPTQAGNRPGHRERKGR